MTVTEATSDVHVAETEPEEASPTGLAGLVGTGDPRTIGKLFVASSLAFAVGVGITGLVAGIDLVDSDSAYESLPQVLTFHHIGWLLLVVLPLLLGLAHAVVPLQAGSSTVAFPRASALSYWGWLASGGLLVGAFIADGGPFGGDVDAVGLSVLAMVGLVASLCTATVSVMTTALALRAPGMTLRRLPTFSWSLVVGGTVWLLTLPVLAGLLVLYYADLRYGGGSLYPEPGDGEHATYLWDQVRWIFWQPAVYAVAIPALGIIGDIVPVFAGRRPRGHGVVLLAIGLFGAVSFGAWAQLPLGQAREQLDAVTPGEVSWLYSGAWVTTGVVALLAMLMLLAVWTVNLLGGRPRLGGPLLLALVSGLMLLVATATGVATTIEEFELAGTSWMTAQAYLVLVASFTAVAAGIVMWAPKVYGKLVPDVPAKLLAPVLLVGGLLVGIGYAVAGVLRQPWALQSFIFYEDNQFSDNDLDTVEALHGVAAGGLGVVLFGAVVLVALVLIPANGKRKPGDDPWGGHTLEWTVSSPPPVGNFAELPEVTSAFPLDDLRQSDSAGELTAGAAEKEVSA